ncbi:unnamed protein product, partial [Ectocarpus sp. 4 AP-2014]
QTTVSGLRKILKKHDKQVRDKFIAKNYLSTRAKEKYSSMRQLYNNAGVMALVASLRNAFEVEEGEQIRIHRGSVDEERGLLSARAENRTLSEFSCTEGVLVEIANQQRALAEAQYLTTSKYLSLQVLLDGSGLSTVDEGSEQESARRELHRPSAYINLATTFLYMTNYYIVGPTSAEYAAALGGSPAVSGLIIGMTPIAACFSCLLYSWWTNTSFRGPLLLCSAMLIVGNFLYGLALTYDAFWMVLVGRMLIGLGGARGVNRRYIADTIPIASRTAYSAAFVAAGALGMAFGPAVSAVLIAADFTMAGVEFNGLTNPGWIMFVLWVVMGALIQCEFQEPPHYMSGNSDLGSDELDRSASSTPTHDRLLTKQAHPLLTKRAAVAAGDESGKLTAATGGGTGAYGSTAAGAAGLNNGDQHEKLLAGGEVGGAAYRFDWSVREVGMLMAVLGMVVLPVNALVGRMSMSCEDRVMLQVLAVFAGIGCLVIVDFSMSPFRYTEGQYVAGVSLAFVAMQAHEGVIMSITSKIIPVELAKGTWNSGFLATEAGTFGRFVGDALITVLGVMTLSSLDFLLFFPSVFLV